MKIESLRVVRASMPRIDPEWRTASYAASEVQAALVEVSAGGAVGVGALAARPPGKGTPIEELEQQLSGPVRELVVGQDALARTALLERLHAAGLHRSTVSAVDIALHDLLGQVTELPCYALWGGAALPEVHVVRMVGIKPPDRLVAAVGDLVEQGYTHVKVKLGTGIAEDVERIRALRQAYGDRIWIGIDGNGAYSVEDAIALSRALEPLDVRLIEQPIEYADLDGLARLTAASPVPIMADQVVNSVAAALEVCRLRAAHVVAIKIGQTGSIDECRQVARMCLAFGLRVHVGGGAHPAVIDAAAAHVAVSVPGIDPEAEIGECFALAGDPTSGYTIEGGRWRPGAAPGFGVAIGRSTDPAAAAPA
ncbi:MAG TPA: enolase C-terminal domain-like protein [bacterium]|nr:enolase C-terminal domain-like protein [bacterium]